MTYSWMIIVLAFLTLAGCNPQPLGEMDVGGGSVASTDQTLKAIAGADITIKMPTNSILLSGSSLNGDGAELNYAWTKKSGGTANIQSANSASTQVSNLAVGRYVFQLKVSDNFEKEATDEVNVLVLSSTCSNNKIYISKGGDNGKYINGDSFSYMPGDTFVLKASANPYSYFSLENIHGTSDCPVTIINEGGQVTMTAGMAFNSSSDIIVNGSGASGVEYGFLIDNNPVNSGVGYNVYGRSKNIEFHHSNITNKTYGFWVKHEADCDPNLQYPNWVIDNISIHDNLITNVGQEGMYLGSTSPNGMRAVTCNGVTTYPIPMRLGNIKVYNNTVDKCNRTGIQLSGGDSGVNEIYNNVVTNTGYELNYTQGSGIIFGGYTHGSIHHNTVKNSFNIGIMSLGAGEVKIENNIVDGSGYLGSSSYGGMSGIMVDTRSTSPVVKTKFIVRNNQIGTNTDVGLRVYKSYDTYEPSGNIVCNNTGTKNIENSLTYSTNCSGTTSEVGPQ